MRVSNGFFCWRLTPSSGTREVCQVLRTVGVGFYIVVSCDRGWFELKCYGCTWWRRQCATGLPTCMVAEAVCDRPAYVFDGEGSVQQACLLLWWRRQCATGFPTCVVAKALCDRPAYFFDGEGSVRQACLLVWWRRQCATGLPTCMVTEAVCDRPAYSLCSPSQL